MSAPDVVDDDDAVHGVDRLPGDAENAARAMDEIVADSDEDGGDTDEDVPDQPEDDYESDGDDQEWALGFCERAPAETLQRQFFPSKVGGRPAWLDPVDVPTAAQLKCLYTREPLDFLLQVYASVDDEPTAFHRAVFLFVSPHGGDLHRPGAVRAFRSQLPRINPFYPDEPCEPGDPLQELTDAQHAAYELRHDRWSDDALRGAIARRPRMFPERELVVEREEFLDDDDVTAGIAGAENAARVAAAMTPAEEGSDEWKEQMRRARESLPEALRGVGDDVSEAEVRSLERAQDKNQVQLSRFHLRLRRTDPTQVLRYCFDEGAEPLWPSVSDAPERDERTVPPCPRCGSPRRFEFQVLPTLVNHLDVDSELNSAVDFGSIAVYTCARSCAPPAHDGTRGVAADGKSEAYAEECVLVHPPLNA